MQHRSYSLLGMTQSLCPDCLKLVSAKIIERAGRVYFRKSCLNCGSQREDFVCSDVRLYDQLEFCTPGKIPPKFGVEPKLGCPHDCGLCTEHEQHTCVGLIEITSNCNLRCPTCYASSGPGGNHLTLAQCKAAIDRLVEVEGRPEVLQLSGGEPTIHPQFYEILEYAVAQPADVVMINTNGIRLAHDDELLKRIAALGPRVEIYLQFDGFRETTYQRLRGEPLLSQKLAAVDRLGKHGIRATLVTTIEAGVNDDELGAITRFGLERPFITGLNLQPTTYSGRYVLPEVLDRRVTFPDVIAALVAQTEGLFEPADFMPLPCAHPNCHSLSYVFRSGGRYTPLPRFIDARSHPELFAGGIMFTRPRLRSLMERFLGSNGCCSGGSCEPELVSLGDGASNGNGHPSGNGKVPTIEPPEEEFFRRAIQEDLSTADVFRVLITSFLDAYTFDVRRLMQCCIHHVLPSGHLIPFCAYNVLYRDGHVSLPELIRMSEPVVS